MSFLSGWWNAEASSKLPQPTGPHAVGYRDLEWQQPSLPQPTLLRLFYPSSQLGAASYGRWIPDTAYYPSYGHYLGWPAWISGLLWRLLDTRLWARPNMAMDLRPRGLIIFSHGLGGLRTTYSAFCTEMASQGWLVAALEHRDGSASLTLLGEGERQLPYQRPQGDDFAFRSRQLAQRVSEVEAAHAMLFGNPPAEVCWIHRAGEAADASIPKLDAEIPIVLAGHSFGAATAFAASKRLEQVKDLIAMDPWMFPLTAEAQLPAHLRCLTLNSQTFHWPVNWEALRRITSTALDSLNLTIRGTAHMDQSDLPSVLPSWSLWRLRPTNAIPPHQVLGVNHGTILAWLEGREIEPDQNLIRHE